MKEKSYSFCKKEFISEYDTIMGHNNQLYHYDCYMEYIEEMQKVTMPLKKEICFT